MLILIFKSTKKRKFDNVDVIMNYLGIEANMQALSSILEPAHRIKAFESFMPKTEHEPPRAMYTALCFACQAS